ELQVFDLSFNIFDDDASDSGRKISQIFPYLQRLMLSCCDFLSSDNFARTFIDNGQTVLKAMSILTEHGVPQNNVIILNLFCTQQSNVRITSQMQCGLVSARCPER
uniref:Uncharacterized protein n=1 Tax=Romanomermis culicivorax TaxID=13658 RepID=A0A915IAS8_ROMCU